jgi:hypothetical protein
MPFSVFESLLTRSQKSSQELQEAIKRSAERIRTTYPNQGLHTGTHFSDFSDASPPNL